MTVIKKESGSELEQSLSDLQDRFADRHIGPTEEHIRMMLGTLGISSLEELVEQTVPESIRSTAKLDLPDPRTEQEVLNELRELSSRNQVYRSYIGMGYHDCITPTIIQRNIFENPGWYTQYTPYQPEISQGRLEALLNFQTMINDLAGMDVANASLLDEGTAAAESMNFCLRAGRKKENSPLFFIAEDCHPQTIDVVRTRAKHLGIEVIVGNHLRYDFDHAFGALLQYPNTEGSIMDPEPFCRRAHDAGVLVAVATDLLALTLLRPPGEFGADVVFGSTQRFGVPLGFGGPHAAFMATRTKYRRQLPGRLVGISRDAAGQPALRLALQTREQHIRREKATSNICTAQVLLAVMASMYAVYHGPEGLKRIARRIHGLTAVLARGLEELDCRRQEHPFFDTLRITPGSQARREVLDAARYKQINLRSYPNGDLGVALDETTTPRDVRDLYSLFGGRPDVLDFERPLDSEMPLPHRRSSDFLTHSVFHRFHTETEMLRYMYRLQSKDLSLATSMIPLGSCTMKLNATTEMIPVGWKGFAGLHPFVPREQSRGYQQLIDRLESWLTEITGFPGITLQPNAGSQGEYTGLLIIRAYHASRGQPRRNICLIPQSAHGTNPASATLAGMKVVVVACDAEGNIDLVDLQRKAHDHRDNLAALMVTYPSTHGVFEEEIREVCSAVHDCGGQIYLDGANMNALVGLCRPGEIGADACHLNLHKTFSIPHGGGGPGMGPVCVASHLQPFLPRHTLVATGGDQGIGSVSSAPWGSPGILPISYAYIAMMGAPGLTQATRVAILNANYVACRLAPHFPVLYTGKNGRVAHECIVDVRPLEHETGISVEDVAKRLMDYGFHAPTMSFPVPGTLMIEPTESESMEELDRFCDALIAIREEIREIEQGKMDKEVNPLKCAPHSVHCLTIEPWDRPYSREKAVFPAPWVRERKFWPAVERIDNAYGDRNLCCAWPLGVESVVSRE